MKRTVTKGVVLAALLAVFVLPVRAQHYIGARAGWGVGYGRFAPVSWYPMKWVWGTWSAGIQWKYYGKVRYIGAVAAELEFLQRAYQEQASLDSEDYTRRVYSTVNLPLIWHIHMNFSDNRLRVFLNAGIWASYNVGAYEWVKSGNTVTEGPYHMTLVKDNPLGYGLLGGIGLNVVMGKWELMLEGRYYFSYGDIMRNSAVYAGNPVRSPLDNISLSLGFFYRLGDKPHTPAAALVCTHHRQKGGQACAAGAGGDEENGGDGRYRRDNGRGDVRGCRGNRDGRNNRYGGYRGRSGRDNNGRVWNRQDKAR